MKLTKARPIYIAIMAAYEAGRGISLSAAEVHELAQDDAIAHRAAVCLPNDDDFLQHGFTWTSALKAAGRALLSTPEPEAVKPCDLDGSVKK